MSSTTYVIYRFSRPTKKELSSIDHYSDYDSFWVNDEEFIQLYRQTDTKVKNIVSTPFARKLQLPEKVIDYEKLYTGLEFSKEAIQQEKIHLRYGNNRQFIYSDGENDKIIQASELNKYRIPVPVDCIAIKVHLLWNNNDEGIYPDDERISRVIPMIDNQTFVRVSNNILAKAEIPFLIFERNHGKCFIEKY